MTLKSYLLLMSIGAVLCWTAWVFVLFSVDPFAGNFFGVLFFYISLFLASVGSFSVIGFLVRRMIIKNDEIIFRHVKNTFRQSILISFGFILALVLLSFKLLRWWNAPLLLLLFIFIEGIVFSKRRHSATEYV